MKHLFFTFIAVTLFSFKAMSQNENISGSIYIKLIDVHTAFVELPDKDIKQIKDSMNNPYNDKRHTVFEKQGFNYLKFLVENNYMHKPIFKLKTDSGKIINVFIEEAEYLKLKKELKGFDKEKERINLTFEGIKKSDGFFYEGLEAIYYAHKITFVKKVLGETDWKK